MWSFGQCSVQKGAQALGSGRLGLESQLSQVFNYKTSLIPRPLIYKIGD